MSGFYCKICGENKDETDSIEIHVPICNDCKAIVINNKDRKKSHLNNAYTSLLESCNFMNKACNQVWNILRDLEDNWYNETEGLEIIRRCIRIIDGEE
jgi:hypothetical protein